ncbi:MAG: ribosome recycling factor [Actinobacteria bacterium]|nr:ribosome recycling factor [Actinomycetota bacterium]
MISEITTSAEENMEKAITSLSHEFGNIRTGRASATMLDRIQIDYYGAQTPITQVAGVKSPDAHMLIIEPWDKSALKAIEKAILASDLGINPSNDGSVIRLPFPPPTEERRKELVKQCKTIAEEAKVAIRNNRRDANAKLEHAKKEGEISEDDLRRAETEIQKLTDKYVAKIEEVLKHKEAEVMEV